ncbi:MAG: hypothetical protein ACK4GC_01215 [Paracoccaceae bacterium]
MLGENGAGNSTIAKAIMEFHRATSDRVQNISSKPNPVYVGA